MIHSEYYENYRGPNLTKATYNKIYDITEKIRTLYGEDNNWQGKLWTYKEIFGETSNGSDFYCEFHSDDGRKHWFHGFIEDSEQYFNPPLATPMNQKQSN